MSQLPSDPPGQSKREWLVEFLRDRDAPCPLCGYNLRALSSNRCPECGRELRLSVNLAEPYLRAWVIAVVAACAAGGMGVLVLLIATEEGMPRRGPEPLIVALYYFIASIPVAAIVIASRARFLRLARGAQGMIAAALVALLVLGLFAFFLGLHQ